tara:strand:- start:164 stop:796 length:633 start_codon:yes stop_codon:yes gene_type:complete
MLNRTIYLAGPDGVGKTMYLNYIERTILEKKTQRIWIRSPKILSKPLMLFCRLIGLTRYKLINNVRYGVHDFHKSPFVSFLFPFIQLIDFKIKWFLEKRRICVDDVILFDRFNLDTLADLMVDTHKMKLHKSWVGKQFIKMLPENSNVLILKVNENNIRERKKDTLYDENLALKIKVYEILSKDLGVKTIDNNRDINIVKKEIINHILNE